MHLWIHPITIGNGKKLFAEGTQPMNWKLIDSKVGKTGLIFATYEPTGLLQIYK
jgi:dihydrofolate reductase